jgi:glycosyltransferase involved in cell wall biosynthesis
MLTEIHKDVKILRLPLWENDKLPAAKAELKAQGFDAAIGILGYERWPWLSWLFAGSGVPLIAGEPNPPTVIANETWHPYGYFGAMAGLDAVQVLLKPYAEAFPDPLRERIRVIGNPISGLSEAKRAPYDPSAPPVLLGVGRFDDGVKGFSLLILAFAELSKEFPEWKLKLVGDGSSMTLYKTLVNLHKIENRVEFTGAVPSPAEHYASAEVFCMPSRFEAFGIVLAEAASYELPLSGLATCVAAKALIQPGHGTLAAKEDHKTLIEALRPLMAMTTEERRAMGQKAREFFIENYSPEKVFDAWERLVEDTVKTVRQNKTTQLGRIMREAPKNVKDCDMDAGVLNLEIELGQWGKKYNTLKQKHDAKMATLGAKILQKKGKN